MKIIGIYKITNIINNKVYIGSSINIKCRIRNHKCDLSKGRHKNPHLQSSANKYGIDKFRFEVIETCSKSILIEKEQYYLDTLKPQYNILVKAYSPQGYKHTEEFKKKASIRMKNSIAKGILNPITQAKLTEDIIRSIINDIKFLSNTKTIITKYNISRSTFHSILQGRTWKHITQNLSKEDVIKHKEFNKSFRLPCSSRIPIEKIQGIKEYYLKGEKITHIAKKFNVCRDTVYDIIK